MSRKLNNYVTVNPSNTFNDIWKDQQSYIVTGLAQDQCQLQLSGEHQ